MKNFSSVCFLHSQTSLLTNWLLSKGENVVVQLYLCFELYFLLLLDMVMHDNKFATKDLIQG